MSTSEPSSRLPWVQERTVWQDRCIHRNLRLRTGGSPKGECHRRITRLPSHPRHSGIDLRRHDTADIVRDCQREILTLLSCTCNSIEFRELIPSALEITGKYIRLIRTGQVPLEKLVLEKRLSKSPEEYKSLSRQAIAAQLLHREGRYIHAGQNIRYIVAADRAMIQSNRAVSLELLEEAIGYDTSRVEQNLRTYIRPALRISS